MVIVADPPQLRNAANSSWRARLHRSFSRIRLDEVVVLQGPPLFGAAFSIGKPSLHVLGVLAIFIAASCLLIAHVFVLNDWSEAARGAATPAGSESRHLWTGLLAGSLGLFAFLGWRTLAIAATIALLSALYSVPACHAKGIPLVNSTLHLVGGVLHFLLGYSLFRRVDLPGVETAFFFALTFVAGHLVQEVRDHRRDQLLGIRTNAVAFGKGRTFAAGLVIFALADLLLVVLALRGVVPFALSLAALLFPVQIALAIPSIRQGLVSERVRLFQWHYRVLYAFFGLVILVALFFRVWISR